MHVLMGRRGSACQIPGSGLAPLTPFFTPNYDELVVETPRLHHRTLEVPVSRCVDLVLGCCLVVFMGSTALAEIERMHIVQELTELDGTYVAGIHQSFVEIAVPVPSRAHGISVATLSATVERIAGTLECCYSEGSCYEVIESPDLLLIFGSGPNCDATYIAENSLSVLPPEILEENPTLWAAEVRLSGAAPTPDCPNYLRYLLNDPTLRIRVVVEPSDQILACSWKEPAQIVVSDVVIRFTVFLDPVSGEASSWGAVKSLLK